MNKIIDPNKPLPSNTIYKWHECFAKVMLEYVLPNDFNNLKIKDKPDLQNIELNLGIEVTTAENKKDLEMERLYTYLEYDLIRDKQKVKNKIEHLGGSISNGILVHPVRYRNLDSIKNSILEKLNKLNGNGYQIFGHNYIFITESDMILEKECAWLLDEYIKLQNNFRIKFEKVYIYQYGGKLFEFNMVDRNYNIYTLNSNETYQIGYDARKIVEEHEKIIN